MIIQFKNKILFAIATTILTACDGSQPTVTHSTVPDSHTQKLSGLCLSSTTSNDISSQESIAENTVNTKITLFIERLRLGPGSPQDWIDLSNAWIQKSKLAHDPGYYLHAQDCINQSMTINNQYIPAKELQIQVMLNNHQFSDAANLAKALVKNEPSSALGWAHLSDAYLELGDLNQAQIALDQLKDLNAGMAFFTRRSYLQWLQGNIKEANSALLAALQRRDQRNPYAAAWTYTQGADISWHRNDLAGAEALYKESLTWLPNYPNSLMGLAKIAIAREDGKKALEILNNIQQPLMTAESYWLKADAFKLTGNMQASIKAQTKLIQLARASDPLLLSRFYADNNRDLTVALNLIKNEKSGRGGIYIEDTYSWILYRLGRFEDALAASNKALSWGTQDAKLFYHAGAINIAAGNIEEGVTLLRKSLALQPFFDLTSHQEARYLLQKHGV